MAATSMGWRTSTMLGIRSGKRTWISRTTVGQAEEISGRGRLGSRSFSLMARATTSAPRATSNTSSKPRRLSAVSTTPTSVSPRNWPYSEGAGRAMVYLYFFSSSRLSVIATLAW